MQTHATSTHQLRDRSRTDGAKARTMRLRTDRRAKQSARAFLFLAFA